ncbi:hypothetical protein COCCU_00680 [Corynebacterium occultum]|uniref:Virginiamycin B lyase n=1 Tax=Corynebacterium occultum TaxID=2675219 RepID=A0A6B8VXP4_9CORY|nr:hypothetical protein [Corynebacterium occultum]QGU06104.1 hypothetical protein COCCU_00680 [Corynebacterium occultum]
MAKLLVLARDLDRIEMIDTESGEREVIITDTGPHPDGVVCDGSTIYWTTMGERTSLAPGGEAVYGGVDGGVHAIDVDGAHRRDIVAPGGITTGKQVALDARGNLYLGNREGFSLVTVGTDGSGLRDLVKHDGSDGERDWIVGVAIDEANGHIYWSQKGSFTGGDGRIFRAGLEIPVGETAENRSDIEVLWENLPAPIDLELIEDRLLWTDRGSGSWPGGNSLNRAKVPPVGQKGEPPTILGEGFGEAIGLAVEQQKKVAYVADLSGKIWKVPAPEGLEGETALVLDLGFPLTGLNLVQ